MKRFVDVVKKEFAFLQTELGFSLRKPTVCNQYASIVYVNKSMGVGVEMYFEPRDMFMRIRLHKVVDGEILNNPIPLTRDSQINAFDLEFLIPKFPEKRPIWLDNENLGQVVRAYATKLREYGGSILGGDFSCLPAVEKKIKDAMPRTDEDGAGRKRS